MTMPLAKMFPHLRIANQDLPEIMPQAQNAWEKNVPEALLDDRVEFVASNFFEDIPVAGKDVYYLRNIIHDWPDVESTVILRNIRQAMGPNSRVLIHDCVLFRTLQEPGTGVNEFTKRPNLCYRTRGRQSHIVPTRHADVVFLMPMSELWTSSRTLVLTRVYDLVATMVMEFRIAQD
ncbi:O-methyltransferase-domain-containing protein [Suillus paluster]|uniref:O-methyltransferase-domain-containing protein n=1 Tax=Suillus paluster TaxID=48578 RepID=UPI001B868964|nr:O-methyltransferase-domain-containing protein [Suillus paluster]KAG1748289.1 O-methyltransferase-domain-containing protein [Suillus paluster]